MIELNELSEDIIIDNTNFRTWVVLAIFIFEVTLIHFPLKLIIPYPYFKTRSSVRFMKISFPLNYCTGPIIGTVLLLATTSINALQLIDGILGDPKGIQPLSVLILVFSLAYICVSLDLTGLFSYLALLVTKYCGKNGRLLFISFFILTVIIGAIASNDVVILTLTPLICYFSDALAIDPLPFLLAEFIAANTASMALYVGNPTNVVISMAYNISFLKYSQFLSIPFLFSIVIELALLLLYFWKKIPKQIPMIEVNPKQALLRPKSAIIGIIILLLSLLTLIVSSIWHVEVWIVTLPFALIMLMWDLTQDWISFKQKNQLNKFDTNSPKDLNKVKGSEPFYSIPLFSINDTRKLPSSYSTPLPLDRDMTWESNEPKKPNLFSNLTSWTNRFVVTKSVLSRLPWGLLPFLLGMFVMVQALHALGWTTRLAQLFIIIFPDSPIAWCLGVGFISALLCGLFNNLPASILLAKAMGQIQFNQSYQSKASAILALIIACNLGANFTPAGSLAGLMWRGILKMKGKPPSTTTLLKACLVLTPSTVMISLLAAILQVYTFPIDLIQGIGR